MLLNFVLFSLHCADYLAVVSEVEGVYILSLIWAVCCWLYVAKPLPDGASAGLASSEYVSKCEVAAVQDDAAWLPKDLSKAKNAHLLEEIFKAHSENSNPVAIGTSSENKMSDKETSELVGSSVPDVSVTVSGSNLAKNVASFPSKDVASSPGASTLPSQIVFDELGLKGTNSLKLSSVFF